MMLGLADLIGAEPYVLDSVRDGSVINQLIPTDPHSNSGSGSKVAFGVHNEVVHEQSPPDFLILLCLRGNPMAKTGLFFLEDVIKFLPPQILEELQKPNFMFRSGDAKVFKETKQVQCPILTKDSEGQLQIRINTSKGRCEALTPDAKFALDYINHVIERNVTLHGIALEKGDILLIDNKRTGHGRSEFDAGDDPDKRRWIQRVIARKQAGSEDLVKG